MTFQSIVLTVVNYLFRLEKNALFNLTRRNFCKHCQSISSCIINLMKCHIISLTFYCVFPSDIVNFSLFLIQRSHQLILFILFFNALQTRSLVLVVHEEHGLTYLKINYHLTCPVPDSLFWVFTTRFANNSKIKLH